MSEVKGQAGYSRYDEMTTEQLRELLRKHAHDELEIVPDTEELFYIMEVLANRESKKPEKQTKSAEEAYETFVKHYAPEMADNKPIPFSKHGAVATRWMKRVAVVAVVCVALTTAAVSAKAFAPELWNKVACWTKEFFHFEEANNGTGRADPDKNISAELVSLQEVLVQHNISEKIMPTWLPEGYTFLHVSVLVTPQEQSISAKYERNGDHLIIQIRELIVSKPYQVEKNDTLIEIYSIDGVDYYIFSNDKYMQTAWIVGEYECLIIGKLTLEDMKKVIDSI